MDSIANYFSSLGVDLTNSWKVCALLLVVTLVLTILGRLLLGKKSNLLYAISSSIGVLFLYIATILIITFVPTIHWLVNPLPLATIGNETISFFQFAGADYASICSALLSLIILAFLMNIVDRWLPKGKNIIVWLLFRVITVVLVLVLHGIVTYLFVTFLPQGLVTYAPTVLLAILILMLMTGALKLVIGAVAATVNPLFAVLYTFFFASFVGKQITRAVLTSAFIAVVVYFIGYLGISTLSIAKDALAAYIPFVVALTGMWYVVHRGL